MIKILKSSIWSKNAILAFGVMIIGFLGMSIPEWLISADWGAEFRPSALQQSVIGIFFGGMMLLMPLSAGIVSGVTQCGELHASMFCWKLLRSTRKRYIIRQLTHAFILSGLVVMGTFVIQAAIWNCIAYPCDIELYPYHEILFPEGCLYADWYSVSYGIKMYLWIAICLFFCAGIWALVSMATAIWLGDRLMAVVLPTCIYYLLAMNIINSLFGWHLPHPADLYNDALTWETVPGAVLEHLLIGTISVAVYSVGLRRRLNYA